MGIASLDAALSGLRVSQQQISVISNNVANVGTEGYTRKILPQSSQSINGVTVGVRAESIIRQVNINLERDLWTQESSVGFYDVQSKYLGRVDAFHGPPDAELSVSAELGRLHDTFAALADSPESAFLQSNVIDQARDTANKINELSSFITTLRNDAQEEITQTVNQINGLLSQIATFNKDIKFQAVNNRSTAAAEDQRSLAIRDLSELMEVSFFKRGDGVVVVQTNEGIELAGENYMPLVFNPTPQTPSTYYPDSASAVYVGDPAVSFAAFDISARAPGGKLGGLLSLRDEIFPRQMAQLDELAHKTAMRFEAQGLRLFTDASGGIPGDTAPDPTIPTPVEYVGFSALIQVNEAVLADHGLLQQGTYGATLESGSSEVIQRILDYTFGTINYQQAVGTLDLSSVATTVQDYLGIRSQNTLNGSVNLNAYANMADLIAAGGLVFDDGAGNEFDNFVITFDDPDFGGSYDIEIDLSAIVPTGTGAGAELIAAIQGDADWANAVTDFGASVSIGAGGQLVISSRGNVTIAAGVADPISDTGFAFLGIGPGTYEATDPYFDIQVGSKAPVRITIQPGDDETDLLAKLQAVPGLAVEDFTASADGFLRLRPGNDYTNPDFGGSIRIIAGPSQAVAANAAANGIIGPGTIVNGLNIVSALFGTFAAGPPLEQGSVISSVNYGSETNGALSAPIPTTAFRTNFLGPAANISTQVIGSSGLLDYAQKMINQQSQELSLIDKKSEDENTLKTILNEQFLNDSAVNIDEELGHLIAVQTAYAAAARVITAIDELFIELLNALA